MSSRRGAHQHDLVDCAVRGQLCGHPRGHGRIVVRRKVPQTRRDVERRVPSGELAAGNACRCGEGHEREEGEERAEHRAECLGWVRGRRRRLEKGRGTSRNI